MAEELVPIPQNGYNEFLLQTVAVTDPARIKVARYNAAIASNSYCEIGNLHHEKKLYWLGKENDSEKLKQLVSVINAEQMHHVGGDIQRLVSNSYGEIE